MKALIRFGYLGSNFHGLARQPGAETVEGRVLEEGNNIGLTDLSFQAASRTDTGVSAIGNCAVLSWNGNEGQVNGLAGALASHGVFITCYQKVEDDFDARHRVLEREYRYHLTNEELAELDLARLKNALMLFRGEHDFRQFCKRDRSRKVSTLSKIDDIGFSSWRDGIFVTFKAERFLWNQIRRIMWSGVEVAKGYLEIGDLEAALSGKRDLTPGNAGAENLVLHLVRYPEKIENRFIPIKISMSMVQRLEKMIIHTKIYQGFYAEIKEKFSNP